MSKISKDQTKNKENMKMEKKNDASTISYKSKLFTDWASALVDPWEYLSVSDRKKRFRVEATLALYIEGEEPKYRPMVYNFETAKLVDDERNRGLLWGNEDLYDQATSQALYGSRKDADKAFNRILGEDGRGEVILRGCCLIGRTPDGLEAIEREWMCGEGDLSYNNIRLQTDVHELLGRLGRESLDDLIWDYSERLIQCHLGWSATIGGVLNIFERRRIRSVEELQFEAAVNMCYDDEII